MKNLEIEKSVLFDILKKVDSDVRTDYHVGKEDIFVGGIGDVTKVEDRIEVWKMSRSIQIYVGKNTRLFSTTCSVLASESDILASNMQVKHSKNEITVRFYSLKAYELFMSNFYTVEEKKEEKKETKKATTSRKKSKSA